MIEPERVRALNGLPERRGRFVLYWMQAAQRAEFNHALEYAIRAANERRVPVVVFFGLTADYPRANERHYRFMLEGLRETRAALERRGIAMVVRLGPPDESVVDAARGGSLVVVDRDYVRTTRIWRRRAAERLACPLVEVETNVVVPVEAVSPKEEYSAATIRPKIMRQLGSWLRPLARTTPRRDSLGLRLESLECSDIDDLLARLRVDRSAGPSPVYRGGIAEARRRLASFIRGGLSAFDELRNDPNADAVSHMSPYLHFGQISPIEIALAVRKAAGAGAAAFIEELVVRRELSMNFVRYNDRYDSFECLPGWARSTLARHASDRREYVYTAAELEEGRTHDPYWNAAQREMTITGKMHGYMRMYWGKKILEWRRDPADAYRLALRLNDRWELDGRDPNGFAGVAWCFGKHDRPWGERSIFGTVRYMNAAGLRRKFDADAYVKKINELSTHRIR